MFGRVVQTLSVNANEVTAQLEKAGRRRQRTSKANKSVHIKKDNCYAIASSSNPLRFVVVNWDKHPVLDLLVVSGDDDGSHNNNDHEGNGDSTTPAANFGVSEKAMRNRPKCLTYKSSSIQEAREILHQQLKKWSSIGKLVVVGHGVENSLKQFNVPRGVVSWKQQRCTANYPPYMREQSDALSKLLLPGDLKELMQRILRRKPSDNLWHQAAASLDLYRKAQKFWERDLRKMMDQKQKASSCTGKKKVGAKQESADEDNAEWPETRSVVSFLMEQGSTASVTSGRCTFTEVSTECRDDDIWCPSIESRDKWAHKLSGWSAVEDESTEPAHRNLLLSNELKLARSQHAQSSHHGLDHFENNSEWFGTDKRLEGVQEHLSLHDFKVSKSHLQSSHHAVDHLENASDWFESDHVGGFLPSNLLDEGSESSGGGGMKLRSPLRKREDSCHPLDSGDYDDWFKEDTVRAGIVSTRRTEETCHPLDEDDWFNEDIDVNAKSRNRRLSWFSRRKD